MFPGSDQDGIPCLNNPSMKIRYIYTSYGWNFVGETVNGTDDIWDIIEYQTYPRFAGECIAPPAGDVNGDCVFDMLNIGQTASDWLECGVINSDMCY
jgi:hypothetical protein